MTSFLLFWRCPVCDAEAGKCVHHDFQSQTLLPCPFCEGPPVPFWKYEDSEHKGLRREDPIPDDGAHATAHVFCHECGAEGESVETIIDYPSDIEDMVKRAILLWQTRNGRHRGLYDSSNEMGLNVYPRAANE